MMIQSVLLHRSALLVTDFPEMLFNTSTVNSLVTNPRSESSEKGQYKFLCFQISITSQTEQNSRMNSKWLEARSTFVKLKKYTGPGAGNVSTFEKLRRPDALEQTSLGL